MDHTGVLVVLTPFQRKLKALCLVKSKEYYPRQNIKKLQVVSVKFFMKLIGLYFPVSLLCVWDNWRSFVIE